jgi:error-prone DNA polymerase
MPYLELQTTSNYSFLQGASHVEELLAQAKLFNYPALAITDRNTLAGIARAHQRAAETGIRLIIGCRLDLACGAAVLVYPTDRAAYARLCRLLSIGKGRAGKGACRLEWSDVAAHAEGLVAILVPDQPDDALRANLMRLREAFGPRAYLALTLLRRPGDAARLYALAGLARAARIRPVATNDVLYHDPRRRILQDVVTCIRAGCTIDNAGFRLSRAPDRHLQTPEEMERQFAAYPDAVAHTEVIAEACRFSLSELRYQYPHETEPGFTAQETLERLTWEGAANRYGTVPDKVAAQLRHELALIAQLSYAPYFLTVNAIVRFANSRGILCQGRGSAANSAVCYVLGITAIDPVQSNLLFERFLSTERREPPDIDVDFEHERREEVIQWIFETYGRDRAALCAAVARYRSRGAVREVGKALGLSEDVTAALAGQVWGWSNDGVDSEHAESLHLNMADRRLSLTLELARELIGFPRHLSQHPGGFVLTQDRLDTLVPIEPAAMADRQVIEWDKDDIDHLRFMKVDVLGLGMLGCLRRAFDLLSEHRNLHFRTIADLPTEDAATYRMIQRADTIGTFQIESRAQMSMLPRLKPRELYDLVIQVAIVRPGPIQGDMVHPYLRRRDGLEPVEFPTPELKAVLGKTLGVPLFQEQAMQVAMVCAGFTATQADQLRRAMATFKVTGGVSKFQIQLIEGMVARGYQRAFAERTFKQIEGFGSYGFPESHAASFALIAYASAWLKCHHPDIFACALLNAQPMGFYAPAQIVRDARQHGVEIRPVSINASRWDCTLEPGCRTLAVRLGLRMTKGLANKDAARLLAERNTPYASIADLHTRTHLPTAALERLAEADAFACLRLNRRQALWDVRALPQTDLPLFAGAEHFSESPTQITPMRPGREVVEDYRSTGLSLRRHPVSFLRAELAAQGMIRAADLPHTRDGKRITLAGIVLVRQKPGSAKGVMFITLEDETGHANLIVWPALFEKQRRLILSATMLACHGQLQREGNVIHIVANRLEDLSDALRSVGNRDDAFPLRTGRGDEAKHGGAPDARGIKVATRDFR